MGASDLRLLLEEMARFPASQRTLRGVVRSEGAFGESELLVARRGRTWRVAPERWPEGVVIVGMPQWLPNDLERLLCRPLSLAASHILSLGEQSAVAGRLTRLVDAAPRHRPFEESVRPWAERGPLGVEVDVDAGFALAVRSRSEGTTLYRFQSIEFDVEIADDELRPPVSPPR